MNITTMHCNAIAFSSYLSILILLGYELLIKSDLFLSFNLFQYCTAIRWWYHGYLDTFASLNFDITTRQWNVVDNLTNNFNWKSCLFWFDVSDVAMDTKLTILLLLVPINYVLFHWFALPLIYMFTKVLSQPKLLWLR